MNHITYRISLDMRQTESNVVVKMKRDDTIKKLAISLTDGGKPYHITEECRAVFAGKKPDGTILLNPCSIEDCVVTYEVTLQTEAVLGEVKSEIRLYGAEGELGSSPSFTVLIVPPIYDAELVIESHDEVNALTDLITGANSTIQKGKEVVRTGKALFGSLQDKEEELNARAEEIFSGVKKAEEDLVADANGVFDGLQSEHNKLVENAEKMFNGFQDAQEKLVADAEEVFSSMPTTYVGFAPQSHTEAEKVQARRNIGAASQTEADFFHSRLTDGSLVLEDTKTSDSYTLRVHKGKLEMNGATFLTNEDEHRIAEGAKAGAVLYTQQELTEEQKAQARENIGAVSVDIVVQKDKEASVSSLKINHSPETSDSIFLEGSVVDDKDSMVVNALTLRGDFGGSIDDGAVIIRNIHAGEDPTDAATIGQVVRIDQPQNLSEEQKAQARENIGITGTGKDGKTPVYGEDYFTEVDKAEMVSAVISALPKYNGEVVTE